MPANCHFYQVFQGLYDGLLTHKKAPGTESFTVVPDIAEALPVPEKGGKRYVFKIRQGVKSATGVN